MATAILTATYVPPGAEIPLNRLTRRATIRNDAPDGELGPALFGALLADTQAEILAEFEAFIADRVPLELIEWTVQPDRFGQPPAPVVRPEAELQAWERLLAPFPAKPRPPRVHHAWIDEGDEVTPAFMTCVCGEWSTTLTHGDTLVSLADEFAEHLEVEFGHDQGHPETRPWLLAELAEEAHRV